MRRRTYLSALTATVAAVGGCTSAGRFGGDPDGTPATDTETPTGTPPEWERSTDCDGMHDSVIEVEWVRPELSENYAPISFADLTDGERERLETVLREGGYGTCDTSEAFRRFVSRVADHRSRQERDLVHIERDGRYYGLYVEKLDQVYSMR